MESTTPSTNAGSEQFKQALINCDLDPRHYSPHSLRRGGATLLHQQGANIQDIKRQGLWRSEAVNAYISDRTLTASSALHAFAQSVAQHNQNSDPRGTEMQQDPNGPQQNTPQRRHRHHAPQKYKNGPNHKNRKGGRPPPRL